jgi:hypothetical protein
MKHLLKLVRLWKRLRPRLKLHDPKGTRFVILYWQYRALYSVLKLALKLQLGVKQLRQELRD